MSAESPLKPPLAMLLHVALDIPFAVSVRVSAETSTEARGSTATFEYLWIGEALIGQRVIVPWGKQRIVGIVAGLGGESTLSPDRLRHAEAVLDDIAPLGEAWFALNRFAADYYQRGLGEVVVPALPTLLKRAAGYRQKDGKLASRSIALLTKRAASAAARTSHVSGSPVASVPTLNLEQRHAVDTICNAIAAPPAFAPILLFGVTGSGKTEVYLHSVALALKTGRQVLVLVPEINLTPQLEELFRARFPAASVASMHSGMADGERATNWLRAHDGSADILLGTRMAVLASVPRLGLIIVDEEHDPSFKQQEGLRYSARDLALVRAQQMKIPIVLGSATPSLESWLAAERGRYQKLVLSARASSEAALPTIHLINLERVVLEHGFTPRMRLALEECLGRGEQSLLFLNRRGYAPVISCAACGWISDCDRCSAHAVFHKSDGLLHCHHCGWQRRAPRACPTCGNLDIAPLGRGTQRVEETLARWFPDARIARIDRDSTQRRGSALTLFNAVHAGEVDILVGTQMVAKGHDFQNLTLVAVIEADGALFAHNFRAAERLFSNLLQVSGRAGRADKPGLVLIQTRFPNHPLFQALLTHDYPRFARGELKERYEAGLPPFTHQAIVRAEARSLAAALAFLAEARALALELGAPEVITIYDPVPMSMVKIANSERAQLLIEATSRPQLQAFLPRWNARLLLHKTRVQWHLEVDPLEI